MAVHHMFQVAATGHLVLQANHPAVLFQWGFFTLRVYALSYLASIFGAYWLLGRLIRQPGSPMAARHLEDFVLWATLGIILGGRIGHILFYDLDWYLADPVRMLKIWQGGMSYHGGILGVTVAILLFCRLNKLPWLRFYDYIATVAALGNLLVRPANFMNGELWGAPTNLPWGVIFRGADLIDTPRHPTQLYEAVLEGGLLLAIMLALFYRTKVRYWPGFQCGAFICLYGISRFCIEFVREADAQLVGKTGSLHMGQWLSLPMILGGIYLMATARQRAQRA